MIYGWVLFIMFKSGYGDHATRSMVTVGHFETPVECETAAKYLKETYNDANSPFADGLTTKCFKVQHP